MNTADPAPGIQTMRTGTQTMALFFAGLLTLCSAGCNNNPAAGSDSAKPPPPAVPVLAAAAESANVPLTFGAIGWVEPLATVQVKPQISGQLRELQFSEGQFVKVGDILTTIDPRPFEAAVRLAEANLARDEALALDARREFTRVGDMFRDGQASTQERDSTEALALSRAAQVMADQAELEQARLRLEYCTIRAPIDSRAGAALVHAGNIVKENETPIVVLNQIAPIYVMFSVAERHLPEILAQSKIAPLAVRATIADMPVPDSGEVVFIDNQVDRSSGQVRLKARFDNRTQALWPGQFVNVALTTRVLNKATVVPTAAVQNGQAGPYIYVIRADDTVELRNVKVGSMLELRTVISEGVQPGERIVTDGQLRLTPGARIRIKTPAETPSMPGSAANPASSPASSAPAAGGRS